MKYKQKILLDKESFPHDWQEKLVANQEIGGVFLVFLSGKTKKEIALKTKLIKKYCRTLKTQMKELKKGGKNG